MGFIHILCYAMFNFMFFFGTMARREHPCEPEVRFETCKKIDTQRNLMWRLDETSLSFVSLLVTPSCNNSLIKIQWILLDKETRRVVKDMKPYANKKLFAITPHMLPPSTYVLIARVTEKAFMLEGKTVDKECWIRILKKMNLIEYLAPRVNRTEEYLVTPDTNTEGTGWPHCSNPNMRIIVSGLTRSETFTFFSTRHYFDVWVNRRTSWTVAQDTWSWSWTYRRDGHTTKGEYSFVYWESSCFTKSSSKVARQTSSLPNHSGRIQWPQMNGSSSGKPTEKQIYFRIKIKNLTEGYEIIQPKFEWGTEYMFLICEALDTYINGCANRSVIHMCPNYAAFVTCSNPGLEGATTATVLTFKCKTTKDILPHLVFGLYKERSFSSKAPEHILMGWSKTETNIKFRLPISPSSKHAITIMPVDYETFVKFDHRWWHSVDVFSYAQDQGNTMGDRLKVLQKMRDEGLELDKFEELVSGGKLAEAVQAAYLLLSELVILDIADIDLSRFQTELLLHLSKAKWTWEGIEMMVGLLSRFDMDGYSKEIEHSKYKSEVLVNIVTEMKDLVVAHETALTIQMRMEGDFFPELYREMALLFDSNFVKPFTYVVEAASSVHIHIAKAEEYPDYDEEMDKAVEEDYIRFSNNGLKGLTNVLYARAKTHYHKEYHFSAREPAVYSMHYTEKGSSNFVNTTINANTVIELGDAQSIPEDEDFVFTWSMLSKDMFFWNDLAKDIKVPYIFLDYYMKGEQKNQVFNNPPVVHIQLPGRLVLPMRTDGINVPAEAQYWTNKMMDRYIRAYRIRVTQVNFTFAMFISDITPVERLRVMFNRADKKPRLNDFENPKSDVIIFDALQTSLQMTVDEEGYWYIAVLPFKQDVVKSKRKRDIAKESDDRDSMVTPMTRLSSIICQCNEIGIPMSGTIGALAYQTYGILDIPLKLFIVIEYYIIVATIIIVFLYCLLLAVKPYRCKPLELIVFVSDNHKAHRWGYMLKVKTGDLAKCGTTGYVGIQIFGSSSDSQKHILNYPDPEHVFLRNGNVDHFLIATSKSMGTPERMEIWSDCSGFAPEWYCESIRVYDLQRDTNYFFNVQKRFGVTSDLHSHYVVNCTRPGEFSIRQPWRFFSLHFGASHAWNLLDNSQDMLWSYLERLSVILSTVLCTYAAALYFIHPIDLKYKDGIGINNKPNWLFYVWVIFLVTVIVAPVNYFFVLLFRNSVKHGRFRGRFGWIPRAFHVIGWLLLACLITACLAYCLICGPFIAYTVVYDWLVVVIASLLLNIMLCENLFLALSGLIRLSFYCCMKSGKKSRYQFHDIIADVECQRKYLFREAGKEGLRPHITILYRPLHGELIRKRRKETEDKKAIARTFESMLNLWVFAILMIILIAFYYNTTASTIDKHLEDIFVYARFGNLTLRGIYDVHCFADLYEYMNDTLVNFFTPTVWYPPYKVHDPGLIIDMASKFIGAVRIRQQRVQKQENCPARLFVEEKFPAISKCIPELKENYLITNSSFNNKLKHNNSFWFYHKEEMWNIFPGFARSYDGSGYTLEMGKTRANVYYRLGLLRDNNWFDDQTKIILIEFLLYNAYTNLFSDVKLVWERESGFLLPTYRIYTLKLMNVSEWQDKLYIVFLMLFMLVSLRTLILTIYYTIKMRTGIFTDAYYVVLVVMQVLNVAGIVYIMQKQIAIDTMLNQMKNKDRNKYFPYNHVIRLHKKMELCMAFILFMSILLLLKFMKFFTYTIAVIRAMRRAMPTYVLLWIGAFTTLACFGSVAQILYGATFNEFSDWIEGPVVFLHMFMKSVDWDIWDRLMSHEGVVVVYTYVAAVFVLALLRLFFLVVAIWAMYEAKMQVSGEKYRYTMTKYITDSVSSIRDTLARRFKFLRKKRGRVKGGDEYDIQMITPKTRRYRYKNPIIFSEDKMMRARFMCWAILRNQHERAIREQPNAEDMYLMKEISRLAVQDQQIQVYPNRLYLASRKPNEKKTKTVIIPDDRMVRIAEVASMLVAEEEEPEDKPEEEEVRPKKDGKKHVRIQEKNDFKAVMREQNVQLAHVNIILESADAMLDDVAGILFAGGKFAQLNFYDLCCSED